MAVMKDFALIPDKSPVILPGFPFSAEIVVFPFFPECRRIKITGFHGGMSQNLLQFVPDSFLCFLISGKQQRRQFHKGDESQVQAVLIAAFGIETGLFPITVLIETVQKILNCRRKTPGVPERLLFREKIPYLSKTLIKKSKIFCKLSCFLYENRKYKKYTIIQQ